MARSDRGRLQAEEVQNALRSAVAERRAKPGHRGAPDTYASVKKTLRYKKYMDGSNVPVECREVVDRVTNTNRAMHEEIRVRDNRENTPSSVVCFELGGA